ncbi:hypothetical protein ABIF91_006766 [Bradyrhizobium sp. USDA 241]
MRDGCVPDAQAMARAAKALAHDVEAEEGESLVVIDAGDGRDRLAVDFADEEALRIGDGEAGGIGKARIPSLGRGPVDGEGDFVGAQIADLQFTHLESLMMDAFDHGPAERSGCRRPHDSPSLRLASTQG